jgi:DNA polymerase I
MGEAGSRGGARAHVHVERDVAVQRPERLAGKPAAAGLFDDLEPMLFLVDGGNLLWRAAHGWPAPFKAADGRDLTPLFRFVTLLRRALGTYGVFAECVVCFDGVDAWAERQDIDATYKSQRSYDDKDLSFMGWLPEIHSVLASLGVACIELSDHEADDVIATLATGAGSRQVRVLSTDRDYYQLISPTTTVVSTKAKPAIVDESAVLSRFGVTAAQWCDLRTLAGDPSDGIPGLPGVGMKRAAELLAGGATLEDIREHPQLAARWDDLMRWRDLIRLRTDVDIGWTPTATSTPKLPAPARVCEAYGLV